jgi:hypothetical protein
LDAPQNTQIALRSPVACPTYSIPAGPPYLFRAPTWAAVNSNPIWVDVHQRQLIVRDYMPFAFGGDTIEKLGKRYAYWWNGYPYGDSFYTYRNVVLGARQDGGSTGPIASVWASSWQDGAGQANADHFRNVSGDVQSDHPSLRLADWPGAGIRAVLTTTGGSVFVIDPIAPYGQGSISIVAEREHGEPNQHAGDHGFGGMALCLHPRPSDQRPLIYMATVETHGRTTGDRDMVSSLHVYNFDGTQQPGQALTELGSWVFDGQSGKPKLWGIAGIAIGELDGTASTPELVLTTVNGDVVVFGMTDTGLLAGNGTPLWAVIVDGAVGMHNSILIHDFDGDQKSELYVAGSAGLRRFTRGGQP